ncbi:MAG: glycosyltransferase family 39 protein [Acidimicrobiales bacterium]
MEDASPPEERKVPSSALPLRAVRRLKALVARHPMLPVLILGAILRLDYVTQPFIDGFSWRQTSTAMIADNFARRNANILFPEVSWNGPGPSYQGREFQTVTYLASLLYRLIGQHDWIGRGLSIAFGLWGIFALYQLVRRVWDEAHGIAAAFVMALIPGSIFIDRSFLPDPAMVALVVTSCWMLVRYLQEGRPRWLVLAAASGALGFLTKLPGMLVGLPMLYAAVAIVGLPRLRRRPMLPALAVAALLVVGPVVAYYLWARHLASAYPPYHFAGSANWIWGDGWKEWLAQSYFLPRAVANGVYWLWTPPVIGLAFLGLLFAPPRVDASPARAPWFFHLWLLAAVAFYAIGARELVENPWNFHIFNPAVAALSARGFLVVIHAGIGDMRSRLAILRGAAIVAVILAVGHSQLKGLYRPQGGQAWRMGLALRSLSAPGDLVVTIANDIGDPLAIYYSGRRGWTFPPADPAIAWNRYPDDDEEAIRIFEELRASGANWFGVVRERGELWTDHQRVAEHVQRTSELVGQNDDWVIYRILSPQERPQVEE